MGTQYVQWVIGKARGRRRRRRKITQQDACLRGCVLCFSRAPLGWRVEPKGQWECCGGSLAADRAAMGSANAGHGSQRARRKRFCLRKERREMDENGEGQRRAA